MLRSSLAWLVAIFACCLALAPTLASSAGIPPELLQKIAPGISPEEASALLLKSGLTPDQLLALIHNEGTNTPLTATPAAPSRAPSTGTEAPVFASAIERNFSVRAGVLLKQFGYNLIGNGGAPVNAGETPQVGAIQDTYVLGPGDTLTVTLRGQENASYNVSVNRDGTITLPLIAPISAAGRPFGEFRKDLERSVATAYIQTRVYVTVNQIRQVAVQVVGEVDRPGVYSLSGLSTVLDALNLAGGIKKSGSLRDVQLVRGDKSYKIDLYALFMSRGPAADIGIAQGDRIIVPAVGSTVAIAGDVRRPGIYELPAGVRALSSSALLDLANGTTIRGVFRSIVQQIRPDGRQELVDVTRRPGTAVRDGEILYVQNGVDETLGRVTLTGAVKLPGVYSLTTTKSLHDLLPRIDVLSDESYVLFGVVERVDRTTLQRTIIPFSPLHVLEGRENLELESRDVIHVLTVSEVKAFMLLQNPTSGFGASAEPGVPPSVRAPLGATYSGISSSPHGPVQGGGAVTPGADLVPDGTVQNSIPAARPEGLGDLSGSASLAPEGGIAGSTSAATPEGVGSPYRNRVPAPEATALGSPSALGLENPSRLERNALPITDDPLIGHAIGESTVELNGAVRDPGSFPVMPGTTLAELIIAANGLSVDVDLSQVEVTTQKIDNASGVSETTRVTYPATPENLATITLHPFDQIVFHHVYSDLDGGSVTLSGEFRYPGYYKIKRGERLSSVIARAGGLTEVAYPLGAVFTRMSVADEQRRAYADEAKELEDAATQAALSGQASGNIAPGGGSLSVLSQMSSFNQGALGYVAQIAQRLRSNVPLGRMSVVADPDVLATKPSMDIILQPGDSITMPRRPASVSITGEVRNPIAILYDPSLTARDYIERAGGATDLADEDHIFIVLPDGTTRTAENSDWLSFSSTAIPPGSSVVVPRDINPTDWLAVGTRLLTVISQLAITAASIAVINHN